jgi:hypothetical protein
VYERHLFEAVDARRNEVRRLARGYAAPDLIALSETNSPTGASAHEAVVREIDASPPEEVGSLIGPHLNDDLNTDQHGPRG